MPKILVSYRRDDSAAYAGRIADRLRDHFGRDNVFVDIDTIRPGEDFVEKIDQSIAESDALVVVVGRSWISATDAQGRRRLDREDDFVRMEVAKALQRRMRVIPALVAGAAMPEAPHLPADLAALSRRQAIEISDTRFHEDTDRLIEALSDGQPPAPPPMPRRRPSEDTPRHGRSVLPVAGLAGTIAIVLLAGATYWTSGWGSTSPASAGRDQSNQAPDSVSSSSPAPAASGADDRRNPSTSSTAVPGALLQAPAIAAAAPGKTGLQVVWRGTTSIACYLYDPTGKEMLSPGWPLPWTCSNTMELWDVAPGRYQVRFEDGAETMAPLPVTVTRGRVTRIEPPVGQLRIHWNGSNWSRWYLMDKHATKTLSPDYNPLAWNCDTGATCLKDLGPGEYTVKMAAAGYQPVRVDIAAFRITDLTLP
jgi:hypothetical protein